MGGYAVFHARSFCAAEMRCGRCTNSLTLKQCATPILRCIQAALNAELTKHRTPTHCASCTANTDGNRPTFRRKYTFRHLFRTYDP